MRPTKEQQQADYIKKLEQEIMRLQDRTQELMQEVKILSPTTPIVFGNNPHPSNKKYQEKQQNNYNTAKAIGTLSFGLICLGMYKILKK